MCVTNSTGVYEKDSAIHVCPCIEQGYCPNPDCGRILSGCEGFEVCGCGWSYQEAIEDLLRDSEDDSQGGWKWQS